MANHPETRLPPTIAIVGNNVPRADDPDRSAEIDAHSEVWRFNNAPGMSTGKQGRRTTLLWLVNSGGSMQERLEMADFPKNPAMAGTRSLAFPVHPAILREYHPEPTGAERAAGARNDWTDAAIERFGALGWAVTVLPAPHYRVACADLRLGEDEMRKRFPSTGFLATHWLFTIRPDARATVFGFTWQGWDSHSWDAEAEWFAAREREGRLTIVR